MHTHNPHHGHLNKKATVARPGLTTAPAAAAGARDHRAAPVSVEDIRVRAYRKWEAAGQPVGDGVQFWLEAERELIQETSGRSEGDTGE